MAADTSFISELFKNKWIKVGVIIIILCLALFAALVLIKAFKGQPVNFFGLQVNSPEPKTDTVRSVREVHDTIDAQKLVPQISPILLPEKKSRLIPRKSKPDTVVTIINGKNINTGTNFGQVGDNYFEKKIEEGNKNWIINEIDSIKSKNFGLENCVNVFITQTSNAQNVYNQLVDFLKSKGFSVPSTGVEYWSGNGFRGVKFDVEGKCIKITVGSL